MPHLMLIIIVTIKFISRKNQRGEGENVQLRAILLNDPSKKNLGVTRIPNLKLKNNAISLGSCDLPKKHSPFVVV